jgi:hypothetical protein
MNMTVAEFRDYLERLLGDPDITEISRVIDAVNASLNALVAYEPRVDSVEFVGDGVSDTFALPDDYYWYSGFFKADGSRISVLWPSESDYLLPSGEYGVIITPSQHVTFIPMLSNGEKVHMYYYARWPAVTSETDTIAPPYHWLGAIAYFSAAELIIADALTAAGVRQLAQGLTAGTQKITQWLAKSRHSEECSGTKWRATRE